LTLPSFISEPKNVRAIIGEKAKFKLKFSGNPQPGNKNHALMMLQNNIMTNLKFLSNCLVSQ
jgi:hypothetical protein